MIVKESKIIFKDIEVEGKAYPIKNARDMFRFVKSINLGNSPVEYLIVVALNDEFQPVNYIIMGNSDESQISFTISSVLRFVLLTGMNKFVIAHNHPNNDGSFSCEDKKSRNILHKAADLVGLEFVGDYLILDKKCKKMNRR